MRSRWWRGRVVLPEVNLSDARILLEKSADGTANWDFDTERKTRSATAEIGALTLDRAQFGYLDPAIKTTSRRSLHYSRGSE